MNNRGFGIPILLGFIVLICIAFATLYIFLIDTLGINKLIPKPETPNYENVYTSYMKKNSISAYNNDY